MPSDTVPSDPVSPAPLNPTATFPAGGPPVLFRADATPAMGIGHVMRCLAVAEAVRDAGGRACFAAAALPDSLRQRLEAAGATTVTVPGPPGETADRAATAALAAGAMSVMLDGYHFDAAYRAAVRAAGRWTATFDDTGQTDPLHADVVVNAAPTAGTLPYERLAPGARRLLGPAYTPLRRDIRDACVLPRLPLAQRTALLLTFGGSDPLGLTAPVAQRLAPRLPDGARVLKAVGAASPHTDHCAAVAAAFPDRASLIHDSQTMGTLMAAAGLAVSAAGGTAAELAAMEVPSVLVMVADNQEAASAAGGWCRVMDGRAGRPDAVAARIAETALALWVAPDTRVAMADAARGLVDGGGAARIAAALIPPSSPGGMPGHT